MGYTVIDDNRANELRKIFFEKFEGYSDDGIECSFDAGLEILRRQGRIYAIVDTRVISIEGMELAEMAGGLLDMQDECIYCFDDGIVNGSWMLAFTKQSADGRICCRYNDWRTDCQGKLFRGEKLYRRKYRAFAESDHEHCAMCGAKFSEEDGGLKIGWCNHDKPDVNSRWVCDECFCDLKQVLDWHE